MKKYELSIIDNKIVSPDGYEVNNMSVLIDKESGLLKWGEDSFVEKSYELMIKQYYTMGLTDRIKDLQYIKFDYTKLTIEEICTLVNYMIQVSANGKRLVEILNSDYETMKFEIEKLKELGF